MLKKYIIFAGVNGAGKTTLYQTNSSIQNMSRVNLDEIVRGFGDWKSVADVNRAGKEAIIRIRTYFENGISFNQETTLCGRSIIRNIRRAKELDYCVELYFVGLESSDLAKERVRQRVKAGGHGIPDKDIERRYVESIKNLAVILPICDRAEIYDNTTIFRQIAIFENGVCIDKDENIPAWCRDIVK